MTAIVDDFAMIRHIAAFTLANPTKRKSVSMTMEKPRRNPDVITQIRYTWVIMLPLFEPTPCV